MDTGTDRVDKPSWYAKLDRPIMVSDGRPVRRRGLAIALAAVVALIGILLISLAERAFGGVTVLVAGVAVLVFLVWYVIWRRRRNRQLTGVLRRDGLIRTSDR